ncbi:MAG: hypothetical protein FWD85_04705 [Microbacteriaceae bacterium]|nr:hypothetical protein [Microbacteriaceae bacterium]MCL2794591.1 hypothetical protein [Microbacteriaceae bacterium]
MSDPAAWGTPPFGAPPVWAPPPKPGLIPLRPLTFGQLLGTPFQAMRRHLGALFGPALLIQVATFFAALALVGAATGWFAYRLAQSTDADRGAIIAGGVGTVILSVLLTLALSVVGSGLLQGLVVIAVANGALGHKPRAGQVWAATRGRRWALAGFVALVSLGFLVALLVPAGIAAAFVVPGLTGTGGGPLVATGTALGVLTGLGVAVLAAWAWAKTSLAGSAIVLERLGVRAAIARSWSLTRGGFWRVFGAQALVVAICYVGSQVISTPVALLLQFGLTLAFPTGQPSDISGGGVAMVLVLYGVLIVLSLVIGTITSVVEAATGVLLYVDQRMRREGLDLTLTRYVEDVQTGRPPTDPFATPVFSGPAPQVPPQPYGPPWQ